MKFDIEYWIEQLNENIPIRYFKRNVPQYRFVTYINHSIILFKGNHYDATFMFIKRTYDFLEENKKESISSEYLKSVHGYLKELYEHLTKNNLIKEELISKYDEKLKLTMAIHNGG
ncbi:conserved hypothetical protein [Tenacibaculum litopenaei]|uniref:hypothetical protein n=1 Tax=Tenacibaculum litopenaei TaxID=396016 RepID=UPI00389555AD